jgi:hypothetical protein
MRASESTSFCVKMLSSIFRLPLMNPAANAVGKTAQQLTRGFYLPGLTREALAIQDVNYSIDGPLHRMLTELRININDLSLSTPKQWARLARTIRKINKELSKTLSPFETKLLIATLVTKAAGDAAELSNWYNVVKTEAGQRRYISIESHLVPLIKKAGSHYDLPSWIQAFDTATSGKFWHLALKEAQTPEELRPLNEELMGHEQHFSYAMPSLKESRAFSHLFEIASSIEDVRIWSRAVTEAIHGLEYNKDLVFFIFINSTDVSDFMFKVAVQAARNKDAEQAAAAKTEKRQQLEAEWDSIEKNGLPIFSAQDFHRLINGQPLDKRLLICYIRPPKRGEKLEFRAELFKEFSDCTLSYTVDGDQLTIELDFTMEDWLNIQQDDNQWPIILNLLESRLFRRINIPFIPSQSAELNPVGARTIRLTKKVSKIVPDIVQEQIEQITEQLNDSRNIFEIIDQLFLNAFHI